MFTYFLFSFAFIFTLSVILESYHEVELLIIIELCFFASGCQAIIGSSAHFILTIRCIILVLLTGHSRVGTGLLGSGWVLVISRIFGIEG